MSIAPTAQILTCDLTSSSDSIIYIHIYIYIFCTSKHGSNMIMKINIPPVSAFPVAWMHSLSQVKSQMGEAKCWENLFFFLLKSELEPCFSYICLHTQLHSMNREFAKEVWKFKVVCNDLNVSVSLCTFTIYHENNKKTHFWSLWESQPAATGSQDSGGFRSTPLVSQDLDAFNGHRGNQGCDVWTFCNCGLPCDNRLIENRTWMNMVPSALFGFSGS